MPREGEGGNTVAERVLSKAHYVDMLVLVYKAMIEADEFELAEAYDAAEEDYERDVQGGAAGMTRGLVCDAMFELCDLWCRTSQVGEYVAFLLGLLDQLTTRAAGGGGQRTWRSVDDVCHNPIYADWGQQGAGAEHDAAGEWAGGRRQQEEEGSGTGRDEGPHSSGGVDGRRLSKRFSYSKAARLSHATGGSGTGPGTGGSGSQQASSRSSRPSFALRGPGGLSGGGGGGEGGPIWWADHAARMQGNSSATAGGQQQPSSLDTMLGSDRWSGQSSGRSSRQTDASGDAEEGAREMEATTPEALDAFDLPDSVFETNVGIPLIVVVTKADLVDSKAPENPLYCPFTQRIMVDPVVLSDGHTYERKPAEKYLAQFGTSPRTGKKLASKAMLPNLMARELCECAMQLEL